MCFRNAPKAVREEHQDVLEQDKIDVLGHHDYVRLARGLKDVRVSRVKQVQVSNAVRFNSKLLCEPRCQRWRKLRIKPNDHATSTGWSTQRDANRSDA
jgi:hypothetical protein